MFYLCCIQNEQVEIMTPVQLQKYAESKINWKRDILIDTKFKTKSNINQNKINQQDIEDIKLITDNHLTIQIGKTITVFFYQPR